MARLATTVLMANIMFFILKDLNSNSAARLKLTNAQCVAVDPSYITYRLCKLRVIRRGVVALNVEAELHKKITNARVSAGHFKKENGYKPFLFNSTFDFCEFLKKRTTIVLGKILMNFISEFSNLNHSCPYEGDIIVKDLILTEDKFQIIPLPSGDYMQKVLIYSNDDLMTDVRVYYTRIE